MDRSPHFEQLTKLLFYLLIGYLAYLVLTQMAGIISTLFLSLMMAYVLDPMVDWFEAKGINRAVTSTLLIAVGMSGAMGLFLWVVPMLVAEFQTAGERLHAWLAADQDKFLSAATAWIGLELTAEQLLEMRTKIQEYGPQALAHLGDFMKGAAAQTMSVVGWMLNLAMIPVFTFYFLRDFDLITAWVVDHLPRKYHQFVVERAHKVDTVVGDWIRGQVEVALILTVLYAITLWLIGVKMGFAIGIIAGLLSIVPYLGFAFGMGLALLMALLDWQGVGLLAIVFFSMGVIHLIEAYLLAPKIVGEKVGLSPVIILIALLLGGELFGLMGFILAVPVAGALKTLVVEALDWYKGSELYNKEPYDQLTP